MNSGITRQALRRHHRTLLGPAATQLVAAVVIATMVDTQASLTASHPLGDASAPVSDLLDACTVFLGDAVYLSFVMVGVTMSLALGAQRRDIALLRSVGAAPAQVRRSVVLQALATAVPAGLLGTLLAVPASGLWLVLLRAHQVVPPGVDTGWSPASVPIAGGAVTATSVVAAMLAARRTARMKPATALVEVACGRRPRAVRGRAVAGVALITTGVMLAVVLARFAPGQLADAGVFVLIAECVGAGLLAPMLLRAGCALIGRLIPGRVVQVAMDDLTVHAHRLGGALVPIMLGSAFTTVKIGLHASAASAGVVDSVSDRWTDWSGSATFCAFAAVAAVNCLLTVTLERRRDYAALQLAGAGRATVVAIVAAQAVLVTMVAVLASALVAAVTLVPIVHGTLGLWWPHLPAGVVLCGIALIAALVAAATLVPAARMTRCPPVRVTASAQ